MNQSNHSSPHHVIFELGLEELPAGTVESLSLQLCNLVKTALTKAQLQFEHIQPYATPRRLAIEIIQLQAQQASQNKVHTGPMVAQAFDSDGNPRPAALGFAKKLGVDINELAQQETPKGAKLCYTQNIPGKSSKTLLPDILQKSVKALSVPKAMRWGDYLESFLRPAQWICAMADNEVLPITLFGIDASNITQSHRYATEPTIALKDATDYTRSLKETGNVIPSFDERQAVISEALETCAQTKQATLIGNQALLNEVTSLVEWPTVLMGNFDEVYLTLPKEVLIESMVSHQKYFALEDSSGKLLPHFITVSNANSDSNGHIIEGNERVIRPRLADAAFFYEQDQQKGLDYFCEKLEHIIFQAKLGTISEKSQRIENIAIQLNDKLALKIPSQNIRTAARLCKADLATNMVDEFSSLQGTIGGYYAAAEGHDSTIAQAITEHYQPKHASDDVPTNPLSILIAISDKLDTLCGIFAAGMIPSGSKDPYALRRAALGIIRMLIHNKLSCSLNTMLEIAVNQLPNNLGAQENLLSELQKFCLERFKSWALDQSDISTQHFLSVEALALDNPFDMHKRIEAVVAFAKLEQAENLAQANKRVANILAKSEHAIANDIDTALLNEPEEAALHQQIINLQQSQLSNQPDAYTKKLEQLAKSKQVVDAFFEKVMINHDKPNIKANRLALVKKLREQFLQVADISYLAQ